jgi:hypothetical protein
MDEGYIIAPGAKITVKKGAPVRMGEGGPVVGRVLDAWVEDGHILATCSVPDGEIAARLT